MTVRFDDFYKTDQELLLSAARGGMGFVIYANLGVRWTVRALVGSVDYFIEHPNCAKNYNVIEIRDLVGFDEASAAAILKD